MSDVQQKISTLSLTNLFQFTDEQQIPVVKSLTLYGDARNPLFLCREICELLGLEDTSSLAKNLSEPDERVNKKVLRRDGKRGEQILLTTRGLLKVIRSGKRSFEIIKQFKDAITEHLYNVHNLVIDFRGDCVEYRRAHVAIQPVITTINYIDLEHCQKDQPVVYMIHICNDEYKYGISEHFKQRLDDHTTDFKNNHEKNITIDRKSVV
jgi:hypothetical protein